MPKETCSGWATLQIKDTPVLRPERPESEACTEPQTHRKVVHLLEKVKVKTICQY